MAACKICGELLTGRQRALCSAQCRRKAKTAWQLEWQKVHPSEHVANVKAHNDRYPDKRRARRAREAGRVRALKYGSPHEEYTVEDLVGMFPAPCHICGNNGGVMGWDHVVPLVLGGANALYNIKPAHGPCNVRKGVKEVV